MEGLLPFWFHTCGGEELGPRPFHTSLEGRRGSAPPAPRAKMHFCPERPDAFPAVACSGALPPKKGVPPRLPLTPQAARPKAWGAGAHPGTGRGSCPPQVQAVAGAQRMFYESQSRLKPDLLLILTTGQKSHGVALGESANLPLGQVQEA